MIRCSNAKLKTFLCVSVFSYFFIHIGNAQEYLANVEYYGVEEALSNRDVYAVRQDNKGFIWVGTKYGLNRFDGHSFKVFTKENGLASNVIHHILEDDAGRLWIFEVINWFHPAFPTHISIVDQRSNVILPFEEYFKEDLPFRFKDISQFIAGENGELFFSTTDRKLFTYRSEKGFEEITLSFKEEFLPLFYSPSNTIWGSMATSPQFVNTLIEVNRKGEIIQNYQLPFNGEWVSFTGLDKKGNLWFSIRLDQVGDVLFYLDTMVNSLHFYEDEKQVLPPKRSLDWSSRIVFRESDQSMWYKHEPDFTVFRPGEQQLFDFGKQIPEIGNANIQALYFDRRGSAWIGTSFGLYRLELKPNPFTRYLSMNYKEYELTKAYSCRGILKTEEALYVNTYKGRFQINEANQKETTMPYLPYIDARGIQTLLAYFPLAVHQDRQQLLWFSDYTLIQSDIKKGKEKYFVQKTESNPTNNIWSIYADQSGKIWAGTERGLAFLDQATGQILQDDSNSDYQELSNSFIYDFVESRHGHIWLASSSGLYRWSPQGGIQNHYWTKGDEGFFIPNDNVLHIHEDEEQKLWLATGGGGLIHLSLKENLEIDTFRQFTVADGLSNNNIYAVYEDKQEQLWMSSDFGIIKFDKNNYKAEAYLPKDGTAHYEFNRISHYQAEDGKLYFGSLNGVTAFYPEEVTKIEEKYDIPLEIVNYRQYEKATDDVLDYTSKLLKSGKITLQPGDRFQILSFALLEYVNAKQNRYRYKIEGLEEDWTHIQENFLRLGSLPYGKYNLIIQGQGADGRFSSRILNIPVEVLRPYYLQSWFQILALASLLLFGLAFYKGRTRALKDRQIILEKEVKERTLTIQEQAEELRQMDQLKSRFFTNVSHELRTPLTLILGPISSVLKSDSLEQHHLKLLKTAQQNGNELLGLVNEILDLTKMESGKLELSETPVVLYLLVHRIVSSFESLAEYLNIPLQLEYRANRDLQIMLDADKFQKILNNLLSNAFKFTTKGGMVEVLLDDRGSDIQLKVTDSGRGIHPDDLPHVFNRFYQSKRLHTPAEGGTGIGLALCKEYSKLFKGKLFVESTLGKGCVFTFEFPKKEVLRSVPDEDAVELIHIGSPSKAERIKNENIFSTINKNQKALSKDQATILLVEDNHSLRDYIQMVLSEYYNVITAENGAEALEELGMSSDISNSKFLIPDLIISDIMMPIMDGFQLLEKLKSVDEWRHIPVVMLTARAGMTDKLKALRIGVDDYLTKPFEEEELLARVSNLLQNHRERVSWIKSILLGEKDDSTTINDSIIISKEAIKWLEDLEKLVKQHQKDSTFNVERLTELLFISRRQLQRRIKQLTGLSPNQYIQESRLQAARALLETQSKSSVKAIAFEVGIKDVKYFSQQYKKRFGKLPSGYF